MRRYRNNRSFRSRRNGRRYLGVRRTFPRANKARSIVRRFLMRRPIRPEIKYIDTSTNNQILPIGNLSTTYPVSPLVIPRGPSNGQRIGSHVRFRRLKVNVRLVGPSAVAGGPLATINRPDGLVRMIFWTPRVDYNPAARAIESVDVMGHPDFNVATIHRDVTYRIGTAMTNTYDAAGASNGYQNAGTVPNTVKKTFSINFPRNVRFTGQTSDADVDTVDAEKDVLYITLRTDMAQAGTSFSQVCRTTYVDG